MHNVEIEHGGKPEPRSCMEALKAYTHTGVSTQTIKLRWRIHRLGLIASIYDFELCTYPTDCLRWNTGCQLIAHQISKVIHRHTFIENESHFVNLAHEIPTVTFKLCILL